MKFIQFALFFTVLRAYILHFYRILRKSLLNATDSTDKSGFRAKASYSVLCLIIFFLALFQKLSAQSIELSFATQTTDATCNGGANGVLKVMASGGTAPYAFSNDNGTSFTDFSNPHTFTDLAANTYKIKVKDATGTITAASNIIIGEPAIISFTISKTDATCSQANGTATVSVSGGTGSKTITCDICPTEAVSGVFSGLAANTYVFSSTDANNCTKTTSVTIKDVLSPPSPPNALPNITVCNNTSVNITPTGGLNYKFYSSDPTLSSITPLSTGTFYTFKATVNTTFWVTKIIGGCESAPISTNISTDDITPPTALCKAITVQLNGSGKAILTAAQVDNGSTDNCVLQGISINKTSFDCSNLGSNTVIFTATDASGNTSTCSTNVIVEDKIPPSVSCPANITVQLGSMECQKVVNFNVTATDNCTTSPIVTQTAGLHSGDLFGIGTVNIGFKATDASQNTAYCSFSITVNENAHSGSMTCLSQVNVSLDPSCQTRILPSSLLVGGGYGCLDNYNLQLQNLGSTNLVNNTISSNEIGSTIRAIITDKKTGTGCSSLIKVADFSPPTLNAPPAIVIDCDKLDNSGIPLSSLSGEPTVVQECSLPTTLHYNDNVIEIPCGTTLTAPPAGFPSDMFFDVYSARGAKRIIVRTFTVSDRYFNAATTRQVIYIRTNLLYQVLTVGNRDLTCGNTRTAPKDTVINGVTIAGTGYPRLTNNKNFGETFCPLSAGYNDEYQPFATQNAMTIRRNWTVFNYCTNESFSWVQTITVRDAPPTLTLKQNPVITIPIERRIDVSANDLIATLTDDCTPQNRMIFGIRKVGTGTGFPTTTKLTFVCGDSGTYNIEIWVRDEAGNILTKNTPLSIKDDPKNCALVTVMGVIQRENATNIPAKIMLYNANNTPIDSISGSSYTFKDLLPNSRLQIMPTRPNTDWLNGVTTFDIALLSRHLLGIESLTTPYRLIAADVNRDGNIDAVDMLLMRRLILRIIPAFPNNNSWRFVPRNYIFQDPSVPFASDFPESFLVTNSTTTVNPNDFVAIKVGDINLSAAYLLMVTGY